MIKKLLGIITANKLVAGVVTATVIGTAGAGTVAYKHEQTIKKEEIRVEAAQKTKKAEKDKKKTLAENNVPKEETKVAENTTTPTANTSTANAPSTSTQKSGTAVTSNVTTSKQQAKQKTSSTGQASTSPSNTSSSPAPKQPSNPNPNNYPSQSGENIALEQKLSRYNVRDMDGDYRQAIYPELDKIFDKLLTNQISADEATNQMLALNMSYNDGMYKNIRCIKGYSRARIETTSLNSDVLQLTDLIKVSGEYGKFKIFYNANTHTNTIYSIGACIDAD